MTRRFTVLILILLILSPIMVFAQTPSQPTTDTTSDLDKTIVTGDNALSILLTRATQDPDDKSITYTVRILPKITSDRVSIQWSVQGVSESTTPLQKNLTVTKDKLVTEQLIVKPRYFGRTEVRIEVTSYGAGEKYVAAARDQYITNQELEIVPTTDAYQQAKNLSLAKQVAITAVIMLAVGGIAWFAYTKFKQWLAKGKTASISDF